MELENLTFLPLAAFAMRSDTLCKADTRAFALAGSTFISLIVLLKGAAKLASIICCESDRSERCSKGGVGRGGRQENLP